MNRVAVALTAAPPPPGQPPMSLAERTVVVDLDDGEVWFTVTGAVVMDVMADGVGQYLHQLFGAKIPGLEHQLVCMAPASWLREDMDGPDVDRINALAATATTAARQAAGVTLQ